MVDALNALPSLQSGRGLHDLSGRVALVTGAASGLGRAMAWGLACHGADVAIVDRDGMLADACAKEIAQGAGRRAIAATADVSREGEAQRAADQVMTELGRVDVANRNALRPRSAQLRTQALLPGERREPSARTEDGLLPEVQLVEGFEVARLRPEEASTASRV